MILHVAGEAQDDIRRATAHYLTLDPRLAADFLDCVEAALRAIEQNPRRAARLRHVRTGIEARRYVIRRFHFVIAYVVERDRIEVLAIPHQKQDPESWLTRFNG